MKRTRGASGLSSVVPAPLPKVPKLDHIDDTWSALRHLQTLVHPEAFSCQPALPPIVLKHQLYSLLPDRTAVDRQVMSLRDSGSIRILKLGVSEHDYAVVEEERYGSYLEAFLKDDAALCCKLLRVLPQCREVSITPQQLHPLKESQLSALVRHGVLLPRDVGKTNRSWWLGIPGISPFIKSLVKGRTSVEQAVRRSKFKELLESELASRKLKVSKLRVEYHIHDLIGCDQLESIINKGAYNLWSTSETNSLKEVKIKLTTRLWSIPAQLQVATTTVT